MGDLLELIVGGSTEFKLLLEEAPAHIREIMCSGIQNYLRPHSNFLSSFFHESNTNLFKFQRLYSPLGLKPLIFKFAFQSEEYAKSYGSMLGFAIAHLIPENISKEELGSFMQICEKTILLRGSSQLIHSIGKAYLSLHSLKTKSPISLSEIKMIEENLHSSNSLDQISSAISEIAKINSISSPRTEAVFRKWHYSPLPA